MKKYLKASKDGRNQKNEVQNDAKETYICDKCKENSPTIESQSKYYCPIYSLEASFMCAQCSKFFYSAFKVIDKELSTNAESLNPTHMAQELTNKIRPSDEERAASLSQEHEVTNKKRSPYKERPTSLRQEHQVTNKKRSPDEESPTSLRQEHEVTGEETLRVAECSNSFSVAYEVAEKELPPRASREALSTSRATEVSDCDFDAENKPRPKNIMAKNSSDRHFKCSNCETLFKHKGSLSRHMKTQGCAYRCKICNKRCGSTNKLKVHLMKHSVETLLSMQTMNHHQNDPIRCILCNHNCKCQKDLKEHLMKHSNDPYDECEHCKKVFKHERHLKQHINTHNEKNPFTCEICNKSCISKGSLKDHMTKHSDEKSHQCRICPKSYKLKCDLSRHMKKKHNQ